MAAASEDTFPDPSIAELIAARPHLRLHAMDGLVMEGVRLLDQIADAAGTPHLGVFHAGALRGRYRALAAALRDRQSRRASVDITRSRPTTISPFWHCSAARAREPTWSAKANCAASAPPAFPPAASCIPASAKPNVELRLALTEDIGQINVESARRTAGQDAVRVGGIDG